MDQQGVQGRGQPPRTAEVDHVLPHPGDHHPGRGGRGARAGGPQGQTAEDRGEKWSCVCNCIIVAIALFDNISYLRKFNKRNIYLCEIYEHI